MRSIKPGRGPSGMNFAGSIFSVLFGIFWTVMAASMTRGAGLVGVMFPLFGVCFVILGIIQAVYSYQNFKGKNRMSLYDITDHGEEPDPLEQERREESLEQAAGEGKFGYCPYCGAPLESDFRFCPKCGKELPR